MSPVGWLLFIAAVIVAAAVVFSAVVVIAAKCVRVWFNLTAQHQWTEHDDTLYRELCSGDADW